MLSYLEDIPRENRQLFRERYKASRGYGRGIAHAVELFALGSTFNPAVSGSRRIAVIDAELFFEEVVTRADDSSLERKVTPLDTYVEFGDEGLGIPPELTHEDYMGHLLGFKDAYDAQLLEKNATELGRLGATQLVD